MPSVTFECGQSDREFLVAVAGTRLVVDKTEGAGPKSVDFLLMALASCTIGTLRTYMTRKRWPTDGLAVEVSCALDEGAQIYRDIEIRLSLPADLSPAQAKTLIAVAKACRIHKTIENVPRLRIALAEPAGAAVA